MSFIIILSLIFVMFIVPSIVITYIFMFFFDSDSIRTTKKRFYNMIRKFVSISDYNNTMIPFEFEYKGKRFLVESKIKTVEKDFETCYSVECCTLYINSIAVCTGYKIGQVLHNTYRIIFAENVSIRQISTIVKKAYKAYWKSRVAYYNSCPNSTNTIDFLK